MAKIEQTHIFHTKRHTVNSPYEYLNTLSQTQYDALSPAQKVNCICDIARQLDAPLEPFSRDGVVWQFNDVRESKNPREPYLRLYHNAARCVDNNFELHIPPNDYLKYVDILEFECGFNRPSEEYIKKHQYTQKLPGITSIEIDQDSINTDPNDLASVKTLLKKWSHIIHYDWLGKLVDAGVGV